MEVRYYADTDTAYIYLLESGEPSPKVNESEEVAPGVVVDFDGDDRPVGIEIYEGAQEKLAIGDAPLEAEAVERIRREERERIIAEMERHFEETMRNLSELFARERERARK